MLGSWLLCVGRSVVWVVAVGSSVGDRSLGLVRSFVWNASHFLIGSLVFLVIFSISCMMSLVGKIGWPGSGVLSLLVMVSLNGVFTRCVRNLMPSYLGFGEPWYCSCGWLFLIACWWVQVISTIGGGWCVRMSELLAALIPRWVSVFIWFAYSGVWCASSHQELGQPVAGLDVPCCDACMKNDRKR